MPALPYWLRANYLARHAVLFEFHAKSITLFSLRAHSAAKTNKCESKIFAGRNSEYLLVVGRNRSDKCSGNSCVSASMTSTILLWRVVFFGASKEIEDVLPTRSEFVTHRTNLEGHVRK